MLILTISNLKSQYKLKINNKKINEKSISNLEIIMK